MYAGEFVDEAREAAVETRHGKIFEQARGPQIENRMIEPGGLTPEGAGQPRSPIYLVRVPVVFVADCRTADV